MAKFQPGQSGNPAGRKVGCLNKHTQLIKLLEPHAEAIVQKTVDLALLGDANALRLCMERLIPKASDRVMDGMHEKVMENLQEQIDLLKKHEKDY